MVGHIFGRVERATGAAFIAGHGEGLAGLIIGFYDVAAIVRAVAQGRGSEGIAKIDSESHRPSLAAVKV